MITKAQKEDMKLVLGHRYCKRISIHLDSKNIVNLAGKPHSVAMITNVMNGKKHDEIEDAIFELVDKRTSILTEKKKNHDRILKNTAIWKA